MTGYETISQGEIEERALNKESSSGSGERETIEQAVSDYYSNKLKEHGATHQGVDWNSTESQELRFKQLLKVVQQCKNNTYTLNDFGCGFGSLYGYMKSNYDNSFAYFGYDVSQSMIEEAVSMYGESATHSFITGSELQMADFSVASGIFNVRNQFNDEQWKQYIFGCIDKMNNASRKGFSFNMLTSYSDKDKCRDYLYYANPCEFFDYCKLNFSRNVALLHDYDLYEFTIIVRKQLS